MLMPRTVRIHDGATKYEQRQRTVRHPVSDSVLCLYGSDCYACQPVSFPASSREISTIMSLLSALRLFSPFLLVPYTLLRCVGRLGRFIPREWGSESMLLDLRPVERVLPVSGPMTLQVDDCMYPFLCMSPK